MIYAFDRKGFYTSDIELGSDFFFAQYFYVDASDTRHEIPLGDVLGKLRDDTVYAWSCWRTVAATSDEYKGEEWDFYFVGTPVELEKAKKDYLDFMSPFHLYKTVTVTMK